jgi:hypothetical protein
VKVNDNQDNNNDTELHFVQSRLFLCRSFCRNYYRYLNDYLKAKIVNNPVSVQLQLYAVINEHLGIMYIIFNINYMSRFF